MTIRFSNQPVAELIQPFLGCVAGRGFLTDASAVAGTCRNRGQGWVRQAGGVCPRRGRDLRGRYLSFGEREEIALVEMRDWKQVRMATTGIRPFAPCPNGLAGGPCIVLSQGARSGGM